mgnify:CR=1 FL=1|tara:strand:+ start:542 stop:1480 length:939 start_codon:yes stop_codon:yes gene_type:complete
MGIIYTITFFISIALLFFTQKYFIRRNKFDEVKNRSSHSVLATRSGGTAIFFTLLMITSYLYITSNQIFDFSLFLPLGILFTIGLYDDIYQVDFKLKFIFQLIAAKILIDQGIYIESLNGFFGIYEIPYMISQALSIFIIVFIINATNFSDGIDGLAISEVIKCLLICLLYNYTSSLKGYSFIFLITLISIIPLYFFNFKKNYKVFLGDSGSLLLGGVVSVSIIYLNNIIGESGVSKINIFWIFIMCYSYPIIDSSYVILKRLINKKSPFVADQSHLHHALMRKGISHTKCLLIISGLTGVIQFILLNYSTG